MSFSVGGKSAQVIREEMLCILIEIANGDCDPKVAAAQVAACRTVLDALPTETAQEELTRVLGSPAEALAWCEDAIPHYQSMLKAQRNGLDA